MKGKKILLLFIFIAYIIISLIIPMSNSIYGTESDAEIIEKNIRRYGYDKTKAVNAEILKALNYDEHYSKYVYIFDDLKLYRYGEEIKYYITNVHDLDKFMENEKIKNSRNLNLKNPLFSIPMEDKNYSHIFEDNFNTAKQEAKVTGQDERGYSIFDISPDALVLGTINGEILSYAHIDNRLIDTREVMNKKFNREMSDFLKFENNKKSDYNKYKLVIEREEYEEKFE